jgi:hypothetical protein
VERCADTTRESTFSTGSQLPFSNRCATGILPSDPALDLSRSPRSSCANAESIAVELISASWPKGLGQLALTRLPDRGSPTHQGCRPIAQHHIMEVGATRHICQDTTFPTRPTSTTLPMEGCCERRHRRHCASPTTTDYIYTDVVHPLLPYAVVSRSLFLTLSPG